MAGGEPSKYYTGRLYPKVQPLTLLYRYIILDRKGNPFINLLLTFNCFKAQCKFLLGRIYSIRREKFVHTKVENWMSRYAENGRFKNNTDVIRFCLLCSQLFLFSRRFQRQTTINLKLKNFSHSHHLLSSSPSQ